MQLIDILRSAQGGAAVENLAKAFDIDPKTASAVLETVVPQLTERMERNSLSRGGLADIVSSMGDPRYQQTLNDPKALTQAAAGGVGVDVLDTLLWSKDRSRVVAARAASQSGVSETIIKQMLPVIASMVMGGLAKQAGPALGSILGQVSKFGGSEMGGEPLPLPGERPRGGTSGNWGGGGSSRDGPLSTPGEGVPAPGGGTGGRNPLDDLSDILRRGGFNLPGSGKIEMPGPGGGQGGGLDLPGGVGAGGGALWNIIRGILGAALGFQSRGLLSWIIRMFVVKWGWGFLQRILGRILLGR